MILWYRLSNFLIGGIIKINLRFDKLNLETFEVYFLVNEVYLDIIDHPAIYCVCKDMPQ